MYGCVDVVWKRVGLEHVHVEEEEFEQLQSVLGIAIARVGDYSQADIVDRQRIALWKKIGLTSEEIKALKVIKKTHVLYTEYLNALTKFQRERKELRKIARYLDEETLEAEREHVKQLRNKAMQLYNTYRQRVRKINNYRKLLMRTFESFTPLHSLPRTMTYKYAINELIKEIDRWLLFGRIDIVRRLKEVYSSAIDNYVLNTQLLSDILMQIMVEKPQDCKLRMKALQRLLHERPHVILNNIELVDAIAYRDAHIDVLASK